MKNKIFFAFLLMNYPMAIIILTGMIVCDGKHVNWLWKTKNPFKIWFQISKSNAFGYIAETG